MGLTFEPLAHHLDALPALVAVFEAEWPDKHLSPWAAAGFVQPSLRGQGIGLKLLCALEAQARAMGFARLYCGTSTAETLLQHAGWTVLERIQHEGQWLAVYEKAM